MTAPFYVDDSVTLHHGDCLEVLRSLPDSSVDAVITDPPYGIGFMGHAWDQPGEYGAVRRNGTPGPHARRANVDHTTTTTRDGSMEAGRYDLSLTANRRFQAWCEAWLTECLRVLKPGGHLLCFGGSRTWHRLAAAAEDAGFELRDSIAWLFGSGFPKSLDVSKAIDKVSGAERTPVREPYSSNSLMRHGGANTRPWMEAAAEVGYHERPGTEPVTDDARRWQGWGTALKPAFEPIVVGRKPLVSTVAANVLAHGTGALNIDSCRIGGPSGHGGGRKASSGFVDGYEADGFTASDKGRWPANVVLEHSQAAELDRQSGVLTSGKMQPTHTTAGREVFGQNAAGGYTTMETYGDSGGASRFFPTFRYEAKAPAVERPRDGETTHPTVKPLDLMRWLVRLVTPPGGTVLEPFAGSGTTAEACVIEGMRCVAIEREADYLPLIVARLSKPIQPDLFGGAA